MDGDYLVQFLFIASHFVLTSVSDWLYPISLQMTDSHPRDCLDPNSLKTNKK